MAAAAFTGSSTMVPAAGPGAGRAAGTAAGGVSRSHPIVAAAAVGGPVEPPVATAAAAGVRLRRQQRHLGSPPLVWAWAGLPMLLAPAYGHCSRRRRCRCGRGSLTATRGVTLAAGAGPVAARAAGASEGGGRHAGVARRAKKSGKEVLEALRRRPTPLDMGGAAPPQDDQSPATSLDELFMPPPLGWEADLEDEALASIAGTPAEDVKIREVTELQESWGASGLLASSLAGRGGEPAGFLETLKPFVGLEFTRFISGVTFRAPTAIAVAPDGGVVGMAEVKKNGYVFNLLVAPSARRQRLGSRLLSWCATRARDAGAAELWMHVEPSNEEGLAFYRRLGFTVGGMEAWGPERKDGFRISRPL